MRFKTGLVSHKVDSIRIQVGSKKSKPTLLESIPTNLELMLILLVTRPMLISDRNRKEQMPDMHV